ncbi:vitamin B12 ABC transporter ATP-binding protein BtuD [Vibrio renipiscarius]|uniref:vitamin B12 ABC transporter ATP-binding protein BtuD n=1 Tax=Vibrio renipiscarius TaxID=1461322 RepID=UPI003553F9AB
MMHINSIHVGSRLLPLSFEAKPGEIIHVIGPNGSGKSTLLSAVSGLLESQGSVRIGDMDIKQLSLSQLADYRAFLTQSDRPVFNLEVAHYLALSIPAPAKHNTKAIEEAINELADCLQLHDKLHRSIHQLSGGEWQRVRLCAICLQIWPTLNPVAKWLILDEPAAPLDIGQEALLYRLIDKVAAMGLTVLMSNHDLNRTLKHADKALLLDKGVLQGFGCVDEVLAPSLLSRVFNTQVERVELADKSILVFD